MTNFNMQNHSNIEPTRVQRFLWWCAGANIRALSQCRDDWHKFTAVGFFVCLVACMATVSGTFFFVETFSLPVYKALVGGLFWGTLIFAVDKIILTFYHKGAGEWKRLIPRLCLSLLISIAINEPLFMYTMHGDIEREIFNQTTVAVNDTRSKSGTQEKRGRIQGEIDESNTRLRQLEKAVDDAEGEMNTERGGVKTDRTTGRVGEGSIYSIKKRIYEDAKNKLDVERGELESRISTKTQELKAAEDIISTEASRRDASESGANGFWRRHEIMFSLLLQSPIKLIAYLFLALLLIVLENIPVLQKFFAEDSAYDKLIARKKNLADDRAKALVGLEKQFEVELTKVDSELVRRIIAAVLSGNFDGLNLLEKELAVKLHAESVGRLTKTLISEFGLVEKAVPLGTPIYVQAVGFPQVSGQMSIPKDLEYSLTLDGLDSEVTSFAAEVSKDCGNSVELCQATNSDGDDIDRNFLPLVKQLRPDRRLLLHFERVGEETDTAASTTSTRI